MLILLGLCGTLAYFIAPLQGGRDVVTSNTLLASAIAIALFFGATLLLLALSGARGKILPALSLPSPWIFVVLFIVVILLGQGVLFVNIGAAYLFPPWHVLASAMLPLAALAYAVRRLPKTSAQAVLGQFAWGGIGTVLLSLVFELLVGLIILILAALVLLILIGPNELGRLVELTTMTLRQSRDPEQIISVLSRQPAVLITGGLAVLALVAVFVPLIEETIKSLGPAAWIARIKPPLTTALLWGIASGAGYAFSENLLNGASGISPQPGSPSSWAPAMIFRAGTSLVHIATTATLTLGWYTALIHHRRARFSLFFLAAIGAHGFWNFVTLALTAVVSNASLTGNGSSTLDGMGSILAAFAFLILILLIVAAGMWIAWLVRWANRQTTAVNSA